MSVITAIPWHVYLVMFLFSVTIGILVAIELQDVGGLPSAGARPARDRHLSRFHRAA